MNQQTINKHSPDISSLYLWTNPKLKLLTNSTWQLCTRHWDTIEEDTWHTGTHHSSLSVSCSNTWYGGETNWFSPMFLQIATDNCRLSVGSLHLGWYWSVYADLSQYAHLHTCVSEKTCPYWWKKYFQFWYVTETIIYISFGHKLDFCDDIISIYADGECSPI